MLRNFRYDEIKGCEPQNGSHALIPLLILCHFTSLHKMRRRAETDMKRLRTQSSETANGKLFVAFISLIVRSYMLNSLTDYMRKNCCTLKKLMNELDKLKCFDFHTSHSARVLNPPTKAMRTLYELLDIACPMCIW